MQDQYRPLKECLYMRVKPLNEIERSNFIGNPSCYACELTGERCVAAQYGIFNWSSDRHSLDLKLLEECEHRKTIKDIKRV